MLTKKIYLNKKESAEFLGVTVQNIYYLLSKNHIRELDVDGILLIPIEDLSEYKEKEGFIPPTHSCVNAVCEFLSQPYQRIYELTQSGELVSKKFDGRLGICNKSIIRYMENKNNSDDNIFGRKIKIIDCCFQVLRKEGLDAYACLALANIFCKYPDHIFEFEYKRDYILKLQHVAQLGIAYGDIVTIWIHGFDSLSVKEKILQANEYKFDPFLCYR